MWEVKLQNIILVKNPVFSYTSKNFLWIEENLSSKTIYFQNYKWILIYGKIHFQNYKWILIYGKTCFKCLMYMCGSEAMTYMNGYRPQSQHYESSACPHPHYRQPSTFLIGSVIFTHLEENSTVLWLNYNTYMKRQRERLYGWGTIKCKTTFPKPRL